MKLKILFWLTLVAGTVLAVFFTFTLLFTGAYFVEGLTNDTPLHIDKEWIFELLVLLTMTMIILSVILAWFRKSFEI